MDFTKKTTIRFSRGLYTRLQRLAKEQGTSLAELVRSACERQYGLASADERLAAVKALAALELPVGSPEEMARESVPASDELP